jgi:hypothetical protein
MIGAIAGDIGGCGSRFEHLRQKSVEFELWHRRRWGW